MLGHKASDLKDVKNILVIQLGDIGDIVWCIPTLWAIKESIQGVRSFVAVKEGFGDILKMEPSVEGVIEVKKYRGGWLKQLAAQVRFFKELKSRQFDMAIDLRSGDRGAFLAFLSGAPIRVALYYKTGVPFWRNLLFTDLLQPPHVEGTRGAVEQSLRIVRELGIDTVNRVPLLKISDQIRVQSEKIIKDNGLTGDSKWVTLNPFSRWAYKEVPEEKWIEVLNWLDANYKMRTVLVGSPDEREKAEKLKYKCKGEVFNLAGKTTLAELAGILTLSRLHIGVDSAAPHIAAAVGTPTVTIYGPSDWNEWAPIGSQHRVIAPDCDCAPCRQKGCQGTERSRCLDELDTGKIIKTIKEALSGI